MKFLPFAILLALATSLLGQADDKNVTTELVTLGLGRGVPTYYYRNSKETVKLMVSTRGIGAPVTYHGPANLVIYDSPTGLDAKHPDKPKPALHVLLPSGQNRILLIFSSTKTKLKSDTKIRALGISTDEMKPGDYRLYNFAKKSVYVLMNEKKALIMPGKSADISSNSWQSDINDMQVRFGLKDGDGLRQVYSSVWGHRPSRRTFLFIFDRANEYSPFEIRRYHDVPQTRVSVAGE